MARHVEVFTVENDSKATLWIDCETGGLNPEEHDLLTLGFVLHLRRAGQGNVFSHSDDLLIKRPHYRATEEALKINRIDLGDLDRAGQSLASVDERAASFIATVRPHRIGGHNLQFDLGFIRGQLPLTWAAITKQGLLGSQMDTRQVALFLRDAGLLPAGLSLSLESLCTHFQLRHGGHTATGDALSAGKVYLELLKLVSRA